MGLATRHLPVKLIVGFIFKEEKTLAQAENLLRKRFGKVDFTSPIFSFTHTDYYQKEFGSGLKKKFISFDKLIPAEGLPEIKLLTNRIEKKLAYQSQRLVNIDPGILDLSKLILATTKDFKHRIYLQKGIYAEVTLFYQDKKFNPWEWTYPDYKTPGYLAVFSRIRELYAKQLKKK